MSNGCIDHVGQSNVACKQMGAIHFGRQINPRILGVCLGLTCQRILSIGARLERRRIGHGLVRCFLGQFGKAQTLVFMHNEAARGAALFRQNTPTIGRSLGQHSARLSCCAPARVFKGFQGGAIRGRQEPRPMGKSTGQNGIGFVRPIGHHTAPQRGPTGSQRNIGVERANRCRLNRDLAPIGPQFCGNNLR